MAASKIPDHKTIAIAFNNCMLSRDLRILQREIAVRLPSNRERKCVDGHSPALFSILN